MNSIWIILFAAFVGTILGGLVAIVTAVKIEEHKQRLEGRTITLAIVTEIKVLVSLLEMRGYLTEVQNILADLRAGKRTWASLEVQITEDLFPIFRSNRDKIGLLPPAIISDVVKFYLMLDAFAAEVRRGGLVAANQCGEKEFSELEKTGSETLRIGRQILASYPVIPA
jgi:ABC-type amino acid transport system permease subunit